MAKTSLSVSLEKGLKTTFIEQLKQESSLVDSLATVVPSNSRSETHSWISESPMPSLWADGDERSTTALAEASYTLTNQRFQSAIEISKLDLDDNMTGSIQLRIREMAQRASQHRSDLVVAALTAGEASNCYDGTPFFGDSHADRGGGVQSNLQAASGSSQSAIQADYVAAKAAMLKLKDEQNQPLMGDNVGELTILCGPDLEFPMRQVLECAIVGSTNNILVGAAKLIVSPRVSGNDWYLMQTGGIVRGLIYQDRDPITFSSLEDSSDQGFKKESFMYGCRYRAAVGYGHFGKAIKVKQ